jgi:GTP1/Obg family GTP-binding protein
LTNGRELCDFVFESRTWRHGVNHTVANKHARSKLVQKTIRKVATKPYINKLIRGMPGRINELIEKKGWKIKK